MDDRSAMRLRKKVKDVLAECVSDLPDRDPSSESSVPLRDAIQKAYRDTLDEKSSSDLWFHLTDWAWNLEFLVALYCKPEKFTPAQIEDGITAFLVHAPSHLSEAARIAGWRMNGLPAMPADPIE